MDCESVFVALTGAPFPTGGPSDAPIERHLLGCESCRRIAEALRPCEALTHEALPAAERRGLPRYRSEIAEPAYAASQQRSAAARAAARCSISERSSALV